MKLGCSLDNKYKLSALGIESCIVTGREICQSVGLRENEAMLYAQLTKFGFSGISVKKISVQWEQPQIEANSS